MRWSHHQRVLLWTVAAVLLIKCDPGDGTEQRPGRSHCEC